MNDIEEYFTYIQKEGLNGLLPQNMPDNILDRMIEQIDAIDTDSDDTSIVTLFLAVLSIHKGKVITKDGESIMRIKFEPAEELIEKLDNYKISLSMEYMRRLKKIFIPINNLPTLDNILNSDREVKISVIG